MDKKEITDCIAEIVAPGFTELGFSHKSPNIFQKSSGENIFQYEIGVSRSHGGYSLHLRLNLLNTMLSKAVNNVMKKVLTDERMKYPTNWTPKVIADSIKGRTSGNTVAMQTDWRIFRNENESLEEFKARFSVWFYSFDYLDDLDGWKDQLIMSVEFAQRWFKLVENSDYLIDNSTYYGLYILKSKDQMTELREKYDRTLRREQSFKKDTTEVELFYEYLTSDVPNTKENNR